MDNWVPKTQGAMMIRPGLQHLGTSDSDNAAAWIEFVAATDDTALLEITNTKLRVWVDDALITRASVSTTVNVLTASTGWTDNSSGGGSVAHAAGGVTLDAVNTGGIAKITHQATVAGGDQNVEHALAINVTRGPVIFKVGSASDEDDYVAETTLRTGYHSIAFTPTGDFYVTFQNNADVDRIVASCTVESSGTMEVTAPWATADLDNIRFDQSADVVFVACDGYAPYRIERRGTGTSWSVVRYKYDKGPFLTTPTIDAQMKPAATYGNTTVTCTENFFTTDHVGALIRIFHLGQGGTWKFATDEVWSEPWQVTGIGSTTERRSTIVTTGTFVGNLRVQRSFDGPDEGFRTVSTITTATSTNVDDSDDNYNVWYRVGFDTSDYTSGTVTVAVTYTGGGRTGIARITARNSATEVDVEVLSRFSDTSNSDNWQEGWWSDYQIWPTTVDLFEGRLWWFGGAQVFGSVSDDYENYDSDTEGDSGPIVRTIGKGPVDKVYFALPLLRQIFGTTGSEIAMRSSSLDEPLTPTNNSAKPVSTQGSANIRAVAIDMRGVFVQRSTKRVFLLTYDFNAGDYQSQELTLLVPDLLQRGVVSIAVQRQPDTRVHLVLGDGTAAILTYEAQEEVLCWSMVSTDGDIKKVAVLPATNEDAVYYHVERSINGSTKRFLEKWAAEKDCSFATLIHDGTSATVITLADLTENGENPYADGVVLAVRDSDGAFVENLAVSDGKITLSTAATYAHITPAYCHLADCFTTVSQSAATTVTGLSHLEGESVVVWADGRDYSYDESGVQKTYTVSSGQITLADSVEKIVVGLPYAAKWKSTKLAYGAALGTALTQMKRVDHIAFILRNTHNNGLYFGRDFSNLDPMPRSMDYKGYALDTADGGDQTVFEDFDKPSVTFPGGWSSDARICLKAIAPRPATVMASVPSIATHDKA